VGEVDDWSPQLRHEAVHERLRWAAQREHGDALALALELDQLRGDEGLGDPRKALEHVSEMSPATGR
jgi:hypothetical protein